MNIYVKKSFNQFILLIVALAVFSCKKDKQVPPAPDLGYEYFPLKTGAYVIYDVDSIVHNNFTGTIDIFRYQLKETVESKYVDNSGRELYRIERYKRNSDTDTFIITDVWGAQINSTRAEKMEENVWFVKLIFPVKKNNKWNGNSFNSMDEQEYEYTEVNTGATVNGLNFDSTLTVLQADDLTAISKLYSEEKYAKNTGLIYKQYINLDLQKNSGLELTLKINSYGQ